MTRTDRLRLAQAIAEMAGRHARSESVAQFWTRYPGRRDKHKRAASRQFRAVQRLAWALAQAEPDPAGEPVQCPCCGNTGYMTGPDQYVCPENTADGPITLSAARRLAADVAERRANVRAKRFAI